MFYWIEVAFRLLPYVIGLKHALLFVKSAKVERYCFSCSISENQRLSADLKSAKTQLQEVQKKCSELEQKIQGFSQQTDSLQQKQVLLIGIFV